MKITRRQLRQLINEEYSNISERRTRKERKADREDYRERKAEHYKPLRTLQSLHYILGLPGRSGGGGHSGFTPEQFDDLAHLQKVIATTLGVTVEELKTYLRMDADGREGIPM